MDEEKREKTALGAAEEGVDAAALVSSSEAIGHFHAKADLGSAEIMPERTGNSIGLPCVRMPLKARRRSGRN